MIHGSTRAGPVGNVLALVDQGEYSTLPNDLVLVPSVQTIESHFKTCYKSPSRGT